MYKHPAFYLFAAALLLSSGMSGSAQAQEAKDKPSCVVSDRVCLMRELQSAAAQIDNTNWRDQTYRELAKTYAADGKIDEAVALISKIETPDTQAMTIRGIGMAAAASKLPPAEYGKIFATLREQAETITHPPSYAIALTYIAMAQAFAKDNEGAWATAADMENDALRHKAYAETAEIQAESGDFTAAAASIEKIESEAFRNKAYNTVAKLLADRGLYEESFEAAQRIGNAYKKSEAIQYILDKQKPREAEQ